MSEGALIGTEEWCDDCHTTRKVVDDHMEATSHSTSHSYTTVEQSWHVLDLECGHSKAFKGDATAYRDGGA